MQVEVTTLAGIAAGIALTIAAVPTAFRTLDFGHSVGTPLGMAWMALLGNTLAVFYLTSVYGWDWIILSICGVQQLCWFIIVWYGMLPRGSWAWS